MDFKQYYGNKIIIYLLSNDYENIKNDDVMIGTLTNNNYDDIQNKITNCDNFIYVGKFKEKKYKIGNLELSVLLNYDEKADAYKINNKKYECINELCNVINDNMLMIVYDNNKIEQECFPFLNNYDDIDESEFNLYIYKNVKIKLYFSKIIKISCFLCDTTTTNINYIFKNFDLNYSIS